MKKIKKPSKKTTIILLLAILIIAGGILYYLKYVRADTATQETSTSDVNLSPSTEEDKKRAEDNKQRIVEQDEQLKTQGQQPSSASKKTVVPTITYADQYGSVVEVGSYVTGIYEDNGKCTATFTKGSASFAKSVNAVKNVNSVNCPAMSAPVSEFTSKGTWNVVVSYSSDTASGSSTAKQIEVH